MKKARTSVPYGPQTKEEALFHNTEMLLSNFREINWHIKLNTAQIKAEISEEFAFGIDDYLNSLYGAGVCKQDIRLEEHAKSVEFSKAMINVLLASLDFLRDNHELGEEYYKIIYYTYLNPTKLTLEQILASLSKDGFHSGYRTYYRRRQDAIEKLSAVLWGATMRSFNAPDYMKTA